MSQGRERKALTEQRDEERVDWLCVWQRGGMRERGREKGEAEKAGGGGERRRSEGRGRQANTGRLEEADKTERKYGRTQVQNQTLTRIRIVSKMGV